jgi:hypothetical protein
VNDPSPVSPGAISHIADTSVSFSPYKDNAGGPDLPDVRGSLGPF